MIVDLPQPEGPEMTIGAGALAGAGEVSIKLSSKLELFSEEKPTLRCHGVSRVSYDSRCREELRECMERRLQNWTRDL